MEFYFFETVLAIIVVVVTWIGVIASLKWIWKSLFSYTVEKPEPVSEDNQELVDVDAFASLPSSSAPRWKYDVFLSFRGADTRRGITSFLYDRLQKRGIKTFMDDQDLDVGDVISPTLLTAIKESRFAIIVLSQDYASSTWCLEELRNICECMKGDNNRILPLFYDVDPTDVRHQKRSFGDAFTKHEKSGRHRSEKVQQWRDALKKVANFSGWHTLNYKTERELVDDIEESVCNKLRPTGLELKMSIGGFKAFEATKQAIDEVMNALKDDEATTIGVYGMGGVGKTTMAKYVGALAQERRLFDKVIMAVVSQNPDFMKIQQTFAEQLGLKLEEKTEIVRARKLEEKIMGETRILIILDDIWKRIDFSDIGIPSHSKVLLTTRKLDVCRSMDCHANIRLNILSEEDSLNLFVKEARKYPLDKSSNFYDVASEVARECAGLPIALIAVARALRGEGLDRWKEAARRLKASQPPILEDEGDVFKCIKLSYDYLKSDVSKSCFLLCCLFPEDYDIPIEYLLNYGIGKGMFQDSDMLDARATTNSAVKALKESSLLLDSRHDVCVRMHDVIRDMAILISLSEDGPRFLVKVGCELKNWPRIDARKGYSAISLMKNKICKLPEELVCSNLQILLLQDNASLNDIPNSFFQNQKELRVLDLSRTGISLIPQSISFLTNLQALYLDYCKNIIDISVIGKLNKLEILSMRGNALKELPREIGQLTSLRMLDITRADRFLFTSKNGCIGTIPSKVISKLHKLEELYMQCGFWEWGSKIDGEGEETNIGFDELVGLSYLSILKVWMSDANCIPISVEVEPNWVYFDITICSNSYFTSNGQSGHNCRSLSFNGTDTTIGICPDWFVNAVVKNTERLLYSYCKGLSNILVEYDRGRLHGLKVLSVIGCCENLKELMNAITCVLDMPVFENLEELYLEYLDYLKQLCVGELPPGSLYSLKLLKVLKCPILGNVLLPSKLLQQLPNLEKLICESSEVEHVFGCEGFEPDQTNLREMDLRYLDVVTSICNGPAPHGMFQALKKLVIRNCNFQGSLFTFDVAQCLFQLEDLIVSECPVLERVIEERRETLNNKKTILPKLKNLALEDLPMLYKGSATIDFECPSLEKLSLFGCPHLSFPSSASDYFHSRNQVVFNDAPRHSLLLSKLGYKGFKISSW